MINILNWFKVEFTNPITAVAQLIGFVPLALSYFMFLFNDRKKILGIKTASDMLWSIHFILLGELTGGVINVINVARNIIFYKLHGKSQSMVIIPVIFCIITTIGALMSWNGPKSILPLIGSCLAIAGFWHENTVFIRKFNFYATALWLTYGILTFSIPTIICNTLIIISILTAEYKSRRSA